MVVDETSQFYAYDKEHYLGYSRIGGCGPWLFGVPEESNQFTLMIADTAFIYGIWMNETGREVGWYEVDLDTILEPLG
jgi:hypothetical protein